MAETPYPIPRGKRVSDILNGNGGKVYGPFPFKIFDINDVEMLVKHQDELSFKPVVATIQKVANLRFDFFTVQLASNLPNTSVYQVRGVRVAARSAGVRKGTRLDPDALEEELSKISIETQEARRDILFLDPAIQDGDTLMKQGDALTAGPNVVAAADRAEEARDIAEAYASDAVSQGNVPIYGTVNGLPALEIPAGIKAIRTNGHSSSGDGGGWPLAREVANAGPLQAWQRLSNGGTRRWELVSDRLTPDQFGAAGDGTLIDRDAVVAAKARAAAKGGKLSLVGGKTYELGSTATNLGGVVLSPEPDASISGFLLPYDDLTVSSEMRAEINDGISSPWTMVLTPVHQKPLLEKSLWLSSVTADRSVLQAVNCLNNLTHHELLFPGSDTISVNSAGVVADASGIALPARAAGGFRVSLARIRPAEEITAFFDNPVSAGNYGRVGFFRTTNGFIVGWLDNFGTLNIGWKAVGEATGSVSGITWVGRTTVPIYTGRACYMTVRLYDWQTIGILISDKEVWRGKFGKNLPLSLGSVVRAGFGVTSSADYVSIGHWSRRSNLSVVAGLPPVGILVFGDSLSEDWHGAYPRQLREALYGTGGVRADIIANYAAGGHTSAQQLAKLVAEGVPDGVHVAVATLGGNDQQGGVTVATLRSTWDLIKAELDAKSVNLVFILSHLPYTRVEAPGHGGDFTNYLNSHLYRTAMMRWAADNGVAVVQANQYIPPQATEYLGSDDEVMRDNVHWSPMSNRLIAEATARVIAGILAPKYSMELGGIGLTSGAYMNAWIEGTSPVRLSISGDRWVRLAGIITKSSGVVDQSVLQLPGEYAPATDILVPVASLSSGKIVRAGVTAAGQVFVNGTQAGDTAIWLDGITWCMKP